LSGWVFEVCAVIAEENYKNPLVSVGIPTYNRPEGLRRTLQCITGQTYENLEIIVSDNCSPGPETEDVVREFVLRDSRIKYFRQEENQGPTFNLKFVLEKANGEYFMWAADDDEWESHFVFSLLDLLIKNTDVAVSMCGVKRIDDFDNVVDITRYRVLLQPDYNRFRLAVFAASHDVITYYIYGLYRTIVLKKFSKNLDNSFGKDLVVLCEILLSAKIGYIDEVLYIRHIHLKGTAELYPQEEIGKYYSDPLNYLKLFVSFGPYLLRSPNIPSKRKLWIPFMVIRQGIWVGGIYLNQIFNRFLFVARKNSQLDKIAAHVSAQLKNRKRSE
jgi:glycosyltransferase involved in cell wall biosynthesis